MNIGFVGSFILAGVIQSYDTYTIVFYTASACLALTVILHLLNFKNVEDKDTLFYNQFSKSKAHYLVAPGIILVCFFFSIFLIRHAEFGSNLVICVFISVFIYLAFIALKQEPEYREHIIAFMLSIEVGMYDFCICSRYVKLSIRKFC